MALIGAAFGLGFLFGPAIGGGLTIWAGHLSADPMFKSSFSAYWVAGLCLITFLFAFRYLKETLNKENIDHNKLNRFQALTKYFAMPTVGPLIFVFFLSSFGMSTMEATLVLFMKSKFNGGLTEVSFGFAYVGLMIVITQGVLVRRLIPKFGERNILRLGLILMSLGFVGIAAAHSLFAMAVTQTFLAVGVGFVNPSTLGSISLLTDAKEQGAAMGTTQSMASLGRIIGPALGGALFGSLAIESPFIFSGLFTLIGLMVVIAIFKTIPVAGQKNA
jgi:MFS family permease